LASNCFINPASC